MLLPVPAGELGPIGRNLPTAVGVLIQTSELIPRADFPDFRETLLILGGP